MDHELDTTLSAYHDDELEAADRLRVERHLADCPACRSTLHGFADLGARARAFESSADPFAGRRALAGVLGRARTPLWRRRVPVSVPGLAAVALLATGGAFLLGRGGGPGPVSPPDGAVGLARFDRGGRAAIVVVRAEPSPVDPARGTR